jgi:hypothetical protein
MRNIIILLTAILFFSSVSYAEIIQNQSTRSYSGNVLAGKVFSINQLTENDGSPVNMTLVPVLTDGAPSYNTIVLSKSLNNIQGYILADKGCTLKVFPLPIDNNDTKAAESTTLTIADGGVTVMSPWKYSSLGTPRAMIQIDKTEAGSMASFILTVRGDGN